MKKQKLTRYSSEELDQLRLLKKSKTNWSKVRSIKDHEIDFSDSPEISPEVFVKSIVQQDLNISNKTFYLS